MDQIDDTAARDERNRRRRELYMTRKFKNLLGAAICAPSRTWPIAKLHQFLERCEHRSIMDAAFAAIPAVRAKHAGTLGRLETAIARNPYTRPAVLAKLYDKQLDVALRLAANDSTPTELLTQIAHDFPDLAPGFPRTSTATSRSSAQPS
jgi:hypothetical protein